MKYLKDPRMHMVLAMLIFGTIPIFVKHLPLSSGEIALYRAILATASVGIYLLISKQRFELAVIKKTLPLLLLSGFALGFNWILLFEAYNYTTVSTATLCYYFAPVLVTVLSTFLFKERLTWLQILCFCMSTVGLVLITGLGGQGVHPIGILLGLGAAVLYATVVLINKALSGISGIQRTFMQFTITSVVLVPYVALTGGFHLFTLNSVGWLSLMTLGLVHTGVTYCLYFSSVGKLSGQKTALISYLDPLVAVLLSVLVLHETMTPVQIIGGIMILGFSLLNEWLSSKR